ncbi:MAG: FG-GAP-like repeat-containing protein [Saprospiraceae bacterium]
MKRNRIYGYMVGCYFLMVHVAYGQVSYISMHTDATIDALTIDFSKPTGSVAGESSLMNGSAGYTIPLTLPTGAHGVAPDLAIQYNSGTGSSIVGMGWGISGISAISRIGQSMYYDNQVTEMGYSSADRYSMDGNRLLVLSGNYGSPGSVYGFEAENFSRVTAYGGSGGDPVYFVHESKDGTKYEYGNSNNSFVMGNAPYRKDWYLSKIIYPDGTYILYEYNQIYNGGVAEMVLDHIYYTGNALSGSSPFSSVAFYYDERTDANTVYHKGQAFGRSHLLTQIDITTEWADVRSYTFEYSFRNGNSYLTKVTEKDYQGVALNATQFKYGDEPTTPKVQPTPMALAVTEDVFPSNLNNDGVTDMLLAHKASGSYHQYFHGTSDAAFSVTLPTNSRVVGVADNNGDQIEDVFVLRTEDREEIIDEDPPYSNYYQIHTFYVYHNGGLNGALDYSQIYELPMISDTIYQSNYHLNSVYGGDYNGDGLTDYLFINRTNVYITYGQRSVAQPLTPWSLVSGTTTGFVNVSSWGTVARRLLIVDYNGDGRSDLLLVENNKTGIFTFDSPTHVKEIYYNSFGLFHHDNLIYPADFNGDGRTDFLRQAGGQSFPAWYRLISKGSGGFEEMFHSMVRVPSIDQVDYGVYYGDVVSTADYNGDGRSDILLIGMESGVGYYTDLYLSKGNTMAATIHEINSSYTFTPCYTGPDYPGIDGKGRTLFRLYTSVDPLEMAFNPKSKEHLLVKIKTGELHTTIFDYKLMSEKIDQNDDFYERGSLSDATQTVSNVTVPSWLVKDFKTNNGNGTPSNYSDINMKVQSCKYAHAKLFRKGKGIIGFGRSVLEDKWSYLRSINYLSPDPTYGFMYPDSVVTQFVTGTNFVVGKTTQQVIPIGTNRYLARALTNTTLNVQDNRKYKEEYLDYDAYANPTHTVQSTYTGDSDALIESMTLITTYGAYGATFPDKPLTIQSTLVREGTPDYTDMAEIQYNSLGQVTNKKDFAGKAKEINTAYEYHPHGGIKKTTVTAVGVPTKIDHTEYDTYGRFVTEKRNTENDVVLTATYDIRCGKPQTTTDASGVTTTYTYDSWGRQATMTTPAGILYTYIYSFVPGPGIKSETVISNNRPTLRTYYDRLNRRVASIDEGFEGQTIAQSDVYDHRGNIYKTVAPSKAGEPTLSTTHTFDVAHTEQRIKSSTTNVAAFGTTTYAYAYDQGMETTTITAPDGKVTSTKADASGKVVQTTDSHGTTLDYTYYSHGGLKDVKRGDTTLVSITYDSYHRKESQTDISAGTTTYAYDAYGRLTSETNARGQTTTMTYDVYDRLQTVTRPEGTTTYEYWPAGSGYTGKSFKLQRVTGHAGDLHEMHYDIYGRVISEQVTIDGTQYITSTEYDGLDRLYRRTLPSGLVLQYHYDVYSNLKRISGGGTDYVTVNEVNGRGQITKYTLGDGKQSVHTYYHGIPTRYGTTDGSYHINMEWDYHNGNLRKRWDDTGNKDTMVYDDLDRLLRWHTTHAIGGMHSDTMVYASNGNILKKSDVGTYTYDPTRIHAVVEITNAYGVIKDAPQHITYTSFLQPDTITEGSYRLIYTYGYDGQRIKSRLYDGGVLKETKYYMGEYERVITQEADAYVQYVGIQDRLVTIIVSVGNTHTPHYVYTDHLGSIVQVHNSAGNVEAMQNFDPWGRRRNGSTWNLIDENLPSGLPYWLYRGYTGHEHLQAFHLIHMNSRLYDPEVGRMLAPDNVISDGGYSQNYNRYSYAYNNPLKYTDPSGNEPLSALTIAYAIGSALFINSADNVMSGRPLLDGALETIVFGVVSAGISFGIGEAAGLIKNVYLRAGFFYG